MSAAPGAPGAVTIVHGRAEALSRLPATSVPLIVTSPPYPMIPQWDATFLSQGASDYAGMHALLSRAWAECHRVLSDGGILAIVIGDALRRVDGRFRLWPNHATVLERASDLGLRPLPYILWKKPTNKPNAFLGSGFLPPNAYVTLDCEYVLLFRKGDPRRLPAHDPDRYASRYSRAERDRWFSQVWDDIRGVRQAAGSRRTGAFPPEIPARLIQMFSIRGDAVLDPFAGTGTTLWEAARRGRRAIGVERDASLARYLAQEALRRGLTGPRTARRAAAAAGPARRSRR